ncbi:MAG: hypothetical protein QOJ29_2613, partial [Thermoleophilaceae bacterium]|nr:hypothetical protein [Thermoleophilaceae bacterium]
MDLIGSGDMTSLVEECQVAHHLRSAPGAPFEGVPVT